MILNRGEEVPDGNARKRKLLKEYKFWSYEKDQNCLVFNVVCDIKFFNVWINKVKQNSLTPQ